MTKEINHEEAIRMSKAVIRNTVEGEEWRLLATAYLDLTEKVRELDNIIELQHQNPKLTKGGYNYQCGFLDALEAIKQARLPTPPKQD